MADKDDDVDFMAVMRGQGVAPVDTKAGRKSARGARPAVREPVRAAGVRAPVVAVKERAPVVAVKEQAPVLRRGCGRRLLRRRSGCRWLR